MIYNGTKNRPIQKKASICYGEPHFKQIFANLRHTVNACIYLLTFLKMAVEVYEMENILYIIKIILGTQLEVTFRHSCRPGWKCSKYRYQSFKNMVKHIITYLESSNSTTPNVSKN